MPIPGEPVEGEPFDPIHVRPIVRDCVTRKLHLFAAYPDIGLDDLIQEGMVRAALAHARWRASKARYTTWINRCVAFCIIDLYRKASKGGFTKRRSLEGLLTEHAATDHSEDGDLGQWLVGIMHEAKRLRPGKVRRGRKWYSRAQCIAVAALMARLRLSCRGAVAYFTQRKDLAYLLRFYHIPSYRWFHRTRYLARKFVTENRQDQIWYSTTSPALNPVR